MTQLLAQGLGTNDHWQRALTVGLPVLVGRTTGEWAIPWDRFASREHAELAWDGQRLRVRRLPAARNPVFFRGTEVESFEARAGDRFAIGETAFTILAEGSGGSSENRPLVQERVVHSDELKQPFRDAPHRLDVLRRLPTVITSTVDDAELQVHLVNLLLAGIPRADVIALVSLPRQELKTVEQPRPASVVTLHWESRRRENRDFQPSRRLVQEAVARQQRTVLHVWAATRPEGCSTGTTFTMQSDLDWAFCTPIQGEACPGWALYVTGRLAGDLATTVVGPLTESDLVDDLKFAELTAEIFAALLQVRKLQRNQARLSQFFSPTVQRVLTTAEPEVELRPRETNLTVMFCDLRGFSQKVEAAAHDLLGVLQRVSSALGVMTQNIFDHQGVVADFLGDAALGFWGWPLADAQMIQHACQAALGIRRYYKTHSSLPGDPLAGFRVGIGVATGRGVAGRIGPHEQAKVTVFGPVVNLASRLESMTKFMHVPVLIDELTAQAVREHLPPSVARIRRLAMVRPYGLETPLVVSELLPPADDAGLSDEDVAIYERALDLFLTGGWERTLELLHLVSPRDRGKDLLIAHIIAHNHTPPRDWDGVIELTQK